ncbi:MAG: TIM44-like domain-containing protein [Desulfitobacteriaceae bacterium]
MRTWTKRAVFAATTLVFLAGQASLALARGGGGVGGSLGGSSGRSFGGSFSGGGLSGGFGGFSFFPFFWGGPFLGGGGSSGGLFGLLFLLVIGYLVLKTLRRSRGWRQNRPYNPGPRPIEREDYSEQMPVDLSGRPITNTEELQRFAKAISFTRENMNYYAQSFPRWDRDYLVARVRQVYFWLQDAWNRQDLTGNNEHLTPRLSSEYRQNLEGMRARGERNMIKEPVLESGDIEFIHSHLGEDSQHFIAMLSASLIDYTVDAQGRVISGDNTHRLYFTEFWELVWQGENWVLSNIYQEDALEVAKLARGDEQ